MTNTGLSETEPIHHPEQVPSTFDTQSDLTSQGRDSLLKI